MNPWVKILLAAAVVAVDAVVIYIPVTSFLAAYIILARPPWFLRFVAKLYRIPERSQAGGRNG